MGKPTWSLLDSICPWQKCFACGGPNHNHTVPWWDSKWIHQIGKCQEHLPSIHFSVLWKHTGFKTRRSIRIYFIIFNSLSFTCTRSIRLTATYKQTVTRRRKLLNFNTGFCDSLSFPLKTAPNAPIPIIESKESVYSYFPSRTTPLFENSGIMKALAVEERCEAQLMTICKTTNGGKWRTNKLDILKEKEDKNVVSLDPDPFLFCRNVTKTNLKRMAYLCKGQAESVFRYYRKVVFSIS